MDRSEYPVCSKLLGRDITDLVFALLNHHGSVSYGRVFEILHSMCNTVSDQIKKNNGSSTFLTFLKKYSSTFSVDTRGYVKVVKSESALDLKIDTPDGALAAFLQLFLQVHYSKIHHEQLSDSFEIFCTNLRCIISQLSNTEKFDYFTKNPAFTVLTNGNLQAIFMCRSNVQHVDKISKILESELSRLMNKKLNAAFGRCPYYELMSYAQSSATTEMKVIADFIDGLSNLEKIWYFRNRPTHYFVADYVYVEFSDNVRRKIISCLHFESLNCGRIHYSVLIKRLKLTLPSYSEYFNSFSEHEKINFFLEHDHLFDVSSDFHVRATGDPSQILFSSANVTLPLLATQFTVTQMSQVEQHSLENQVVEYFLQCLGKRTMHYVDILQASFEKSLHVLSFFEGYTKSSEIKFFKKHKDHFMFEANHIKAIKYSYKLAKKTIFESAIPDFLVTKEYRSSLGPSMYSSKSSDSIGQVIGRTSVHPQMPTVDEVRKMFKKRFFDEILQKRLSEIIEKSKGKSKAPSQILEMCVNSGEYFRYFLKDINLTRFYIMAQHFLPDIFSNR